jgi:hypothetical protein
LGEGRWPSHPLRRVDQKAGGCLHLAHLALDLPAGI